MGREGKGRGGTWQVGPQPLGTLYDKKTKERAPEDLDQQRGIKRGVSRDVSKGIGVGIRTRSNSRMHAAPRRRFAGPKSHHLGFGGATNEQHTQSGASCAIAMARMIGFSLFCLLPAPRIGHSFRLGTCLSITQQLKTTWHGQSLSHSLSHVHANLDPRLHTSSPPLSLPLCTPLCSPLCSPPAAKCQSLLPARLDATHALGMRHMPTCPLTTRSLAPSLVWPLIARLGAASLCQCSAPRQLAGRRLCSLLFRFGERARDDRKVGLVEVQAGERRGRRGRAGERQGRAA
jgi:hypothetical protein